MDHNKSSYPALAHRSFAKLKSVIDYLLVNANPATHVVVFDIDATVLYNTRSNGCGAEPNFKVQRVYDLATKRGFDIYFVTARPGMPSNRQWTIEQLHCMGFDNFKDLYMRSGRDRTVSDIARFKRAAREDIERRSGKKVLLNMGDQWSDVVVTTPSAFSALDSDFRGKHVLFYPPPEFKAVTAVKLYETRD